MDLSLAALLGENIFNFGELLGHSVLQALQGSGYEWLAELLAVFNAGDLPGYSAFCTKHAAVLNAQPALVAAERLLQEKITIVALTEIVFGLPAEQRTIPLEVIAAKTRLSLDGVERLLMRTLSVHLIEGTIDHVAGTVRITWVQPRVLLPPQIAELRTRLDGWIDKVHAARVELEAATDPERSQWPRQRRESEPQRRTRLLNELAVLNERLRGGSPSEVARTRAKVQWLQNRSWRNWELIRQYMSSSSGAVTLSLIEAANSKARRGGYWAWARQCVSPSRREAVHTTCAAASLAGLGASCTAPPARMDSLAGRPAVD